MSTILADKDEIREAMHAYCFHMDQQRFSELGNLFAADGEWIAPYSTARGPAEVAALMARNVPASPKRVHYVMNSIISVDRSGATARSNYLVILEGPNGPQPSVCGIYDDVFVKQTDGWKFQRRELIHLFKGEMGLRI